MKCPDKDLRYGICKRCLTENPDDRFKSELIIRVCLHLKCGEHGTRVDALQGIEGILVCVLPFLRYLCLAALSSFVTLAVSFLRAFVFFCCSVAPVRVSDVSVLAFVGKSLSIRLMASRSLA